MLKHGYVNQWLLYIAIGIFSISLILPKALKPIYKLWMRITSTIAKVLSFVILGLFFYLVIVPVGLFMKLIGRDPLQRRFDTFGPRRFASQSEAAGTLPSLRSGFLEGSRAKSRGSVNPEKIFRRVDNNIETYWIKRDAKLSDPKRIERQY